MSRIFISLYNFAKAAADYDTLPPFYEGFIEGLRKSGNDVMVYHFKQYGYDFNQQIPDIIFEHIKAFQPELCIFFDNHFWEITKKIDAEFLIYDVDSPILYSNKKKLQEDCSAFKFITIQKRGIDIISEFCHVERSRIIYLPPYTSIRADASIPQDTNISFVGANWLWDGAEFVLRFLKQEPSKNDLNSARGYLADFEKLVTRSVKEQYEGYLDPLLNNPVENAGRLSGLRRVRYLSAVADLGLELHGLYWDQACMAYFPEVAFCYNRAPISSLTENQALYNRSKLAINTNHLQAVSGFSWRVCDIMASNACLVTEFKPDMLELFPNVPLPFFSSPEEARSQCLRLLKDEPLRQDITAASHEVIDKAFRFEHLLDGLASFVQTPLRHPGRQGTLTILSDRLLQSIVPPSPVQVVVSPEAPNIPVNTVVNTAAEYFKRVTYRHLCVLFAKKTYYQYIYPFFPPALHAALRRRYQCIKRAVRGAPLMSPVSVSQGVHKQAGESLQNEHYAGIIKQIQKKIQDGQKIRTAFLVLTESAFPAREVMQCLLQEPLFEVSIIVIPEILHDKQHAILNLSKRYMKLREYYGEIVLNSYNEATGTFSPIKGNFDIVCSANPYDILTLPEYQLSFLCQSDCLTFYINYGYPAIHFSKEVFALPELNFLWRYFVESKSIQRECSECMKNGGANTVVSGYAKMDALAQAVPHYGERKLIIIAPHHSVDASCQNIYLSNFLRFADLFQKLPKIFPNIDFIFRPHPLLFITLSKNEYWGEKKVKTWLQKLQENSNVIYQDGGDYFATFASADGIIHDCSSFLAEWLFTEKFGCYMLHDKATIDKQFLKNGKEMLNYYRKAFTEEDIIRYVQDIYEEKADTAREQRIAFVRSHLKVNYPAASKFIVSYIKEQLGFSEEGQQ